MPNRPRADAGRRKGCRPPTDFWCSRVMFAPVPWGLCPLPMLVLLLSIGGFPATSSRHEGHATGPHGGERENRKIVIEGSTTVAPIVRRFAECLTVQLPGVQISVSGMGSGEGVRALVDKGCDIAAMSRPMKDEEFRLAAANGVRPVVHMVALDGIAVVVHPDNPVDDLSMEQVRGIYSGVITNWKQVGGRDERIVAICRPESCGTSAVFRKTVMQGTPTDVAERLDENSSVRDRVSSLSSAIGYVSFGFLDGVKPLAIDGIQATPETVRAGAYPISRLLFMVTDGYPELGSPVHAIIMMREKPHGRAIVKDCGFVLVDEYGKVTLGEVIEHHWPWLSAGVFGVVVVLVFATYTYRLNGRLHQTVGRLTEAREAATRESIKLRSMIEGMDEGVVVADTDDVITDVNSWFLDKLGLGRDEIVGKSMWDFHPDEVGTARLRVALEEFRGGQRRGTHVVNRDLLGMHLSLRAQPIFKDDQYRGIIINVIDVTDLVESREVAEDATRAKSEFLANMSHEIRTPMTAILGFTEVLLGEESDEELSLGRVSALKTIKRNGRYLLDLINDILDLSKIESGKLEVERTMCSPAKVLADVVSLMRVRAEAKNLPLEVEYVGEIPEKIHSDPTRIRQILINLLGNAVKFTETGTVRVTTRLVQSPGKAPCLQFDVVDSGIGITPEQTERLFQPFTQADASTARRFGGTGLGLTISKRLANILGGDISITSAAGQGSTFTVTIETGPLDGLAMLSNPTEVIAETRQKARESQGPPVRLDCRLLLAEDGPDNQRLISFVLKKSGADVTVAENGQIAREKALAAQDAGEPFDVILMDIQMPVMDGHTATRKLREDGYTGPIVALTANAMAGDEEKCRLAGCDGYATKPIDRPSLFAEIARHLETGASATRCT